MAKAPEMAGEIDVEVNREGLPAIIRGKSRKKVRAIYEHWRLCDDWWGNEVERDYFRLEDETGVVTVIYHDNASGRWYLSKSQY